MGDRDRQQHHFELNVSIDPYVNINALYQFIRQHWSNQPFGKDNAHFMFKQLYLYRAFRGMRCCWQHWVAEAVEKSWLKLHNELSDSIDITNVYIIIIMYFVYTNAFHISMRMQQFFHARIDIFQNQKVVVCASVCIIISTYANSSICLHTLNIIYNILLCFKRQGITSKSFQIASHKYLHTYVINQITYLLLHGQEYTHICDNKGSPARCCLD
eukprot:TRINITY_DN2726_c0_g1_i10.p6 TRINITY_DN2726_c0_g1~~TRINITY_DN2726_c0_g1_i10.p6  ORF type:complete len:214 (-),score=-13.23 TRINITY_DN2726_c0_g1_i10:2888-3529(-)